MRSFDPTPFVLPLFGALALTVLAGGARAEMMDDHLFTLVALDRLEYRARNGNDLLAWEGQGKIGTDYHKLALKSEGEYERRADRFEKAEVRLLYQRLISDFFDVQAGVRYDFEPDPSRVYGVVGLAGLAPQWFETDANLFVSDRGDVSARLEAEYDVLITQRLVLQPSAELNLGLSNDRPTGMGSGVRNVEFGLRLRYEIVREFAPYIGVHWERKLGRTADIASEEGEDDSVVSLVAGVRVFF
ncbi:MAG: copper resistance protein B [Alphaproteobacteria bacterium]|nr:copper resistance protein B [Alphaproteobacteria bacterium]